MIGFKVVRGKKSFRPATDLALQRIRYRIGETTSQSDCGPFALFESLEDARSFAKKHGDCILICGYVPTEENTLWKKAKPVFSRNKRSRSGYSISSGGIEEREIECCPEGTILASEITPYCIANDDDPDDLSWTDPDATLPYTRKIVFTSEGGFREVS